MKIEPGHFQRSQRSTPTRPAPAQPEPSDRVLQRGEDVQLQSEPPSQGRILGVAAALGAVNGLVTRHFAGGNVSHAGALGAAVGAVTCGAASVAGSVSRQTNHYSENLVGSALLGGAFGGALGAVLCGANTVVTNVLGGGPLAAAGAGAAVETLATWAALSL